MLVDLYLLLTPAIVIGLFLLWRGLRRSRKAAMRNQSIIAAQRTTKGNRDEPTLSAKPQTVGAQDALEQIQLKAGATLRPQSDESVMASDRTSSRKEPPLQRPQNAT